MRNLILLTILTIAFTSCQWKNHSVSAREKMACGQWMDNELGNNRERFVFNADRGFQDFFFSSTDPKTGVWQITGNQLNLRYNVRFFIVSVHYTLHYHINTLNDSVMVIASKAVTGYPSRIIALKKMKLNGKFIRA